MKVNNLSCLLSSHKEIRERVPVSLHEGILLCFERNNHFIEYVGIWTLDYPGVLWPIIK